MIGRLAGCSRERQDKTADCGKEETAESMVWRYARERSPPVQEPKPLAIKSSFVLVWSNVNSLRYGGRSAIIQRIASLTLRQLDLGTKVTRASRVSQPANNGEYLNSGEKC